MQYKKILLLIFAIVFASCSQTENLPPSKSAAQSEIAASRLINVSPANINAGETVVAAGIDGDVFVVWVEHRANGADLMIRQYDANGQPKGDAVRVNPQPGQVKTWYGDPPTVKVGSGGAVYVGWTAKDERAEGAANILNLSVSSDGGHSFASPVKINDDADPASHGMHSLAVDEQGHIYVAWLDERYLNSRREEAVKNQTDELFRYEKAAFIHHKAESEEKPEPNAELYFAASNDGGKTFSPNKKLAGNVCPCCKTALLAAADNRLYLAWRQVLSGEFRHIAVASSIDAGNSFSVPVVVSDDQWQISACPVSGAALTENSDKTLSVAWFTAGKAGKQGIYLTESKDAGKSFSPRTLVSENAVGGTPALISGKTKTPQVIWTENDNVVMADFSTQPKNLIDKQPIGDGKLAAATVSGERVFISFVAKSSETNDVKLFVAK